MLVLVEVSDLIFAVDSIPAIFAITTDPFIVLTSNVFAILGLRAMYFLLADVAGRFSLLKYGLALVLMFIGGKMLLIDVVKIPVAGVARRGRGGHRHLDLAVAAPECAGPRAGGAPGRRPPRVMSRLRRAMLAVALGVGALAVLAAGGWLVCPAGACRTPGVDAAGLAALQDWRDHGLAPAVVAVTWLGSLIVLLPGALLLAWRRRAGTPPRARAFVPLALLGAAALAHLAKLAIARPRPDLVPALVAMPADPSFPSAHAMQATAFAMAWLLRPGARPGAAESVAALAAGGGGRRLARLPAGPLRERRRVGAIAAMLWVLALRFLPVWTPRLR